MVDRVDFTPEAPPVQGEAPVVETQGTDRPAWLPAEFKTVEDFTASYTATKAELTRKSQELAAIRKDPDKPADPPTDEPPKVDNPLEIKDDEKADEPAPPTEADFEPYKQEFISTGDVSEDNRVKIADSLKGIFGEQARAVVNDYIEGQKVRRESTTKEFMDAAGGAEQYGAMTAWAKDNLSADEKAAYNRQINSGDFHAAKFAITGLRAKFESVNGRTPNLVTADAPITPAPGGAFKSVQEMTAAMRDARYKTDPSYRKSVEQRVALSNL